MVEKPPAAVIVPLRRRRASGWSSSTAIRSAQRFWEVPQGACRRRPRAAPEDVARGELAEETGLRAGRMEQLGRLFFAYGMSNQPFDVWLAPT